MGNLSVVGGGGEAALSETEGLLGVGVGLGLQNHGISVPPALGFSCKFRQSPASLSPLVTSVRLEQMCPGGDFLCLSVVSHDSPSSFTPPSHIPPYLGSGATQMCR